MFKIFSLEFCPRCDELKAYLKTHDIPFENVMMDSPEGITELRVAGRFDIIAPVLQIDEEIFFGSDDLFPNNKLDSSVFGELNAK